jgi:hypothetical protein
MRKDEFRGDESSSARMTKETVRASKKNLFRRNGNAIFTIPVTDIERGPY